MWLCKNLNLIFKVEGKMRKIKVEKSSLPTSLSIHITLVICNIKYLFYFYTFLDKTLKDYFLFELYQSLIKKWLNYKLLCLIWCKNSNISKGGVKIWLIEFIGYHITYKLYQNLLPTHGQLILDITTNLLWWTQILFYGMRKVRCWFSSLLCNLLILLRIKNIIL